MNDQQEQPRGFVIRHPVFGVIILISLIIAGMWLMGFVDAHISVNKGMSLWDYSQKKNSMNVISRSGMVFYLDHFTDMHERRRELKSQLEELGRIFE